MKKYILSLMAVAAAMFATAQVKTGIEVLRDGGFKQLQGKMMYCTKCVTDEQLEQLQKYQKLP